MVFCLVGVVFCVFHGGFCLVVSVGMVGSAYGLWGCGMWLCCSPVGVLSFGGLVILASVCLLAVD